MGNNCRGNEFDQIKMRNFGTRVRRTFVSRAHFTDVCLMFVSRAHFTDWRSNPTCFLRRGYESGLLGLGVVPCPCPRLVPHMPHMPPRPPCVVRRHIRPPCTPHPLGHLVLVTEGVPHTQDATEELLLVFATRVFRPDFPGWGCGLEQVF